MFNQLLNLLLLPLYQNLQLLVNCITEILQHFFMHMHTDLPKLLIVCAATYVHLLAQARPHSVQHYTFMIQYD